MRESLLEEVTFEPRHKWCKGASHRITGKEFKCRGRGKCKGPEARTSSGHARNREEGQCIWSLVNWGKRRVKSGHRGKWGQVKASGPWQELRIYSRWNKKPLEAFNHLINRWRQADQPVWLLLKDKDLVLLTPLSSWDLVCAEHVVWSHWCTELRKPIYVHLALIFIYSEHFKGCTCFLFFILFL